MERAGGLLVLVAIAGLVYAARSYANTDPGQQSIVAGDWQQDEYGNWVDTGSNSGTPVVDTGPSDNTDPIYGTSMSNEQKIAAFKKVIARFESNSDYGKLYGGGHFYDYSKHPNIRVPFFNPKTGKNDVSTAAGAYQINYPTWQDIQANTGLDEFTPEMQDIAARFLLDYDGVTPHIIADDIAGAFIAASKRWASLPGSDSGQHQQSMQTALNTYNTLIQA